MYELHHCRTFQFVSIMICLFKRSVILSFYPFFIHILFHLFLRFFFLIICLLFFHRLFVPSVCLSVYQYYCLHMYKWWMLSCSRVFEIKSKCVYLQWFFKCMQIYVVFNIRHNSTRLRICVLLFLANRLCPCMHQDARVFIYSLSLLFFGAGTIAGL